MCVWLRQFYGMDQDLTIIQAELKASLQDVPDIEIRRI